MNLSGHIFFFDEDILSVDNEKQSFSIMTYSCLMMSKSTMTDIVIIFFSKKRVFDDNTFHDRCTS